MSFLGWFRVHHNPVGASGIRVNSISPGGVATGIFGKNAGVEGSKADTVLDVVKEMFTEAFERPYVVHADQTGIAHHVRIDHGDQLPSH
jgi:NAD(P)-dependent dehydrogenase (short-subunit alcohol dehydrogenase family)